MTTTNHHNLKSSVSTRTACSLRKGVSRAQITGCTNHKVSIVIDCATSEVHKVAMTRNRADATKATENVLHLQGLLMFPCRYSCDRASQNQLVWLSRLSLLKLGRELVESS